MNQKSTILVTGSNGQLGQEIQELTKLSLPGFLDFNFIFTDRSQLDLGDNDSIKTFFEKNQVDFCINCAAYTAVDKAETEKEICEQINSFAVAELAKQCQKQNATLIHISTDYVFDGSKNSPYLETDQTNPINHYGQTKLGGENLALQNNPKTLIVRTSWVYSKKFGKNFYKTVLRLASEKSQIKIVSDQIGCPTDANDLAKILLKMVIKISQDSTFKNFGIYHFSGDKIMSWFDFAKKIVAENNLNCEVLPIPSSEFPTPTKRPMYSVMGKNKIAGEFLLV
jgi:dTDP-4-dehydrorhamnose reductase